MNVPTWALVVVLLMIIAAAFRLGKKAQVAEESRADQEAREIANEVQNDVGAMPPEDAREELRKWNRDR